MGNTREKPRSVLKKEEKLRVLIVKISFLRIIKSCILSSGAGPGWLSAGARTVRMVEPGGLSTRVLLGVIRGLSGGLTYIQAMKSLKIYIPKPVKRIVSPYSTYSILVI